MIGLTGGYAMVDCTGLDLIKGNIAQTISDIYNRVHEAMALNKPMIAYNCNWNGTPVTPIHVFAIDFGTYVICTAATMQVIINSNNTVTINNLVG